MIEAENMTGPWHLPSKRNCSTLELIEIHFNFNKPQDSICKYI